MLPKGFQEQPLMIKHGDPVVIPVRHIDLVIDRHRQTTGVIYLTGIVAALGETTDQLLGRGIDNGNLIAVRICDDQTTVGQLIDASQVRILEDFRGDFNLTELTVLQQQQGPFSAGANQQLTAIGHLQTGRILDKRG